MRNELIRKYRIKFLLNEESLTKKGLGKEEVQKGGISYVTVNVIRGTFSLCPY